jgi:outer membrane protein assembly complex protein YaeT
MADVHSTFKIHKASRAWRRVVLCVLCAWCILHDAVPADAQPGPAPTVTQIRVEQEGMAVTDPTLLDLIDQRAGQPLSVSAVRASINRLISLNRFDDVQVFEDAAPGGLVLRFVLYPLHPVDRIDFRGQLGLSEDDLRKAVRDRYGVAPAAGRADDVVALLKDTYRRRGYPSAMITPRIEETHNPDRATMVMQIDAGQRARIRTLAIEQVGGVEQRTAGIIDVHEGQPFDAPTIERELQGWTSAMKSREYYEARANHTETFSADGANVTIALERGPRVDIAFTGDPLPQGDRDALVQVKEEGSADEDLLEDATRRIEDYLRARGYRDARANYTRQENGDVLTITFNVVRGPRHTVAEVHVTGNMSVSAEDLQPAIRVKAGDPFVQATVDTTVAGIRNLYLSRGFTKVAVTPMVAVLPPPAPGLPDRSDDVTIAIAEGPRATVRAIAFRGNQTMSVDELQRILTIAPGQPYTQVGVAGDRDRLELAYRNKGFENVVVEPTVMLAENDTRADVRFSITEGPQVIVDHIIIVGNERTSSSVIRRELQFHPDQPLGYSEVIESQQRLSALGLFSRVRIDELSHGGQPRHDVLVQVVEAPPTTISYGPSVEVGTVLRTNENGQAEEHVEVVPRAFFEVGRRNMWGKNRAVDLFMRAALRSQNLATSSADGVVSNGTSTGLNEYRVYGTYREPRLFNTRGDLLVTGILDQEIRSSFTFRTRAVRAEMGGRLSQKYSLTGRYSIERTQLFDEQFSQEEAPLVDKLFPQVRLSKFSLSLIRDTRDDALDPSRGHLVLVDGDVASRAYGSAVSFVKTYVQGFSYMRLPGARRTVLALGARLGAAHGFEPPGSDPSAPPVQRFSIPASERFFAGGDTTVRGFTLDRLGDARTITQFGFPLGGNGTVILNGELRTAIVGQLQGHVFIDGGNVYPLATDIDLKEIRGAVGFGALYKTPVGPVRVDFGFKLDRRELVPGTLERRMVFHVSLGQAF